METLRTRKPQVSSIDTGHKKQLIQEALKMKTLKGSIVLEKVSCGKKCCRVCGGSRLAHGPYKYLHFWNAETKTVKRKYVSKALAELIPLSDSELKQRLRNLSQEELKEAEEILGQVKNEILSFKESAKLHTKLRW